MSKPKRALLAYCALADRLQQPGAGPLQALTPFFAPICNDLAGEMFDAAKFAAEVVDRYGLQIPRLAALGLTEQLAQEGLLKSISGPGVTKVYQYEAAPDQKSPVDAAAVSERDIDRVLSEFVQVCRSDPLLADIDEAKLQVEFLDRLLQVDAMRLLTRREGGTTAKRTNSTLTLARSVPDSSERIALRLDYQVASFLLELRDHRPALFDRVSDIAFASMAAEALACFREPVDGAAPLAGMVFYLDAPLLLDVLGVNVEYAEYGRELLELIHGSGAVAAVLDDCVVEAESVVAAQLSAARSGLAFRTVHWGTAPKIHLLSALKDKVAERACSLGIEVRPDPDTRILTSRSPRTVGDIQTQMTERMQTWPSEEARRHDERSVWSMLKFRSTDRPHYRICDSGAVLVARNTALVRIANESWRTWLQGAGRHARNVAERWAPVAMSDKQLAGYLWLRRGTSSDQVSRTRLLAHCSAAIRPRPDIKARAYNLVLDLHGKKDADHIAALMEDREGERALMRAVRADPEDVTADRLPYILEQVRLGAGEFAAAAVRAEGESQLDALRQSHEQEVARLRAEVEQQRLAGRSAVNELTDTVAYKQTEMEALASQVAALNAQLAERKRKEVAHEVALLDSAFAQASARYNQLRWAVVAVFSFAGLGISALTTEWPVVAMVGTAVLSGLGCWFVPDAVLDGPLRKLAVRKLKSIVRQHNPSLALLCEAPDFRTGQWAGLEERRQLLASLAAPG